MVTRALALVHLIAFTTALTQSRPLLGEHGLTPVPACGPGDALRTR